MIRCHRGSAKENSSSPLPLLPTPTSSCTVMAKRLPRHPWTTGRAAGEQHEEGGARGSAPLQRQLAFPSRPVPHAPQLREAHRSRSSGPAPASGAWESQLHPLPALPVSKQTDELIPAASRLPRPPKANGVIPSLFPFVHLLSGEVETSPGTDVTVHTEKARASWVAAPSRL